MPFLGRVSADMASASEVSSGRLRYVEDDLCEFATIRPSTAFSPVGKNPPFNAKGIVMVDETRGKLVCATVVSMGLLFAMVYAHQTIRSSDSQVTVLLAAIYETLSPHR